MTTETRTCKRCGKGFEARTETGVVHCRECRKARREGTGRTVKREAAHREVAAAGRTCTVRTATAGACGHRAVFAFEVVATGEVFAECATHFGGRV